MSRPKLSPSRPGPNPAQPGSAWPAHTRGHLVPFLNSLQPPNPKACNLKPRPRRWSLCRQAPPANRGPFHQNWVPSSHHHHIGPLEQVGGGRWLRRGEGLGRGMWRDPELHPPPPPPDPREQDGQRTLLPVPASGWAGGGQADLAASAGLGGGEGERMLRTAPPQPRCLAARGTWGT